MPIIAQYAPKSRQDWLDRAESSLKDLPDATLHEWAFGEEVDPLFGASRDREALNSSRIGKPWRLVQRIDHPDASAANQQALLDLANGADELSIVVNGAPSARGYGLPDNQAGFRRSLENIIFDAMALRLEPHPASCQHAEWLVNLIEEKDFGPRQCQISFGLDPVGNVARWGQTETLQSGETSDAIEILKTLVAKGFAGPFFECDTRIFAEAGADPAQELAVALAASLAYIRAIESADLDLSKCSQWIGTTLTASANQTITIAKLRAWRLIWQKLTSDCGLEPKPNRLHAETARLMMMREDSETNLLRTTTAAFSAGVAGTDSLSVLPYSIAAGLPGPLARRLSRNTQLLLVEESHIGKVHDSAAGSGAYETLTDKLAHRAWRVFQDFESEGGILESLRANHLQARIAASRTRLRADVLEGVAPFVGATSFQSAIANKSDILDVAPKTETLRDAESLTLQPIEPFDIEQDFRDQSEAIETLENSP